VTAGLKQLPLQQSVLALEHSIYSLQLDKKEVEKVLDASRDLHKQCQDIVNKLQASRVFYSEMVIQCLSAANNIENSKLVATRPRTITRMKDAFKQLLERLVLTGQNRVAILREIEGSGCRRDVSVAIPNR
jgi:hypothetical protein